MPCFFVTELQLYVMIHLLENSTLACNKVWQAAYLSMYSTTLGCAEVRIMAISFCKAGRSVVLESSSFLMATDLLC
jgi:hypothetical protein